MFRTKRSISEVLADRSGSGLLEGLGGTALLVIAVGALAFGVASHMQALTTLADKAERQALVTSLVGDEHSTLWGTPGTPNTTTVTLPSGLTVPVTTWREDTSVSTRLTAVTPVSAGADAADCSGPADASRTGCVYSSRVHAKNMDELSPRTAVRMSPTTGTAVGDVDSRVSTGASLPQGEAIAQFSVTGTAGTANVLRYLIETQSLPGGAEIVISEGDTTLAKIPVDTTMHSYFGTFSASPDSTVTVRVSSGNAVVQSVFIYHVRSTS